MRRITRRRRLVLASLLAALGAMLYAASASAAWTHYFSLVKAEGVGAPRVAVAPNGSAAFSWERSGGLQTRVRNPDGTLSPIQAIAPPETFRGFESTDLAVDSDGNAFYVWPVGLDGRYVRARVRHANGTLGPVQTLATSPGDLDAGLRNVRVGVDGTGRAVFSWIRTKGAGTPVLQARVRSATGGLGPVVDIGSGAGYSQLTVTPGGRALFAWESHMGILGRAMSAAGSVGPLQQVSTSTHAIDPHVVAAGSRILFSWRQETGDDASIMARELSGGSLTPPDVIASGGLLSSIWPTVAIAPDGRAAFCWYAPNPVGRVRSPSGALGPVETITPDGDCVLDMDASGNVVFGATVATGGKKRALARTQPAGGALGPMQLLSPPGYNASFTLVDVNAAGDAAAVWTEGQRGFAIQAAFGP